MATGQNGRFLTTLIVKKLGMALGPNQNGGIATTQLRFLAGTLVSQAMARSLKNVSLM